MGLISALRWYIGELERRLPLKVTLETSGERRDLPLAVRTALFRVAQEALTNVVKHAAAEQASVHVIFAPEKVEIVVRDSGRGFDPAQRKPGAGWGLLGMDERARLLGGVCVVDSAPGAGTRVAISIPLPLEGKPNHEIAAGG